MRDRIVCLMLFIEQQTQGEKRNTMEKNDKDTAKNPFRVVRLVSVVAQTITDKFKLTDRLSGRFKLFLVHFRVLVKQMVIKFKLCYRRASFFLSPYHF